MTDAAQEFRNKKDSLKKKRLKLGVRIAIIAILVFLSISIFSIIGLFIGSGPKAESGKSTIFLVANGDGASNIANNLDKENLVKSGKAFRILTIITNNNNNFKAGEYSIPSKASPLKILKILANGESLARKVTIPEGWSNASAFERIAANPLLIGEMPELPEEGFLAPDTYIVKKGDSRAALIEQMKARQIQILDELWLKRAPNLPLRSKHEALVLASIVEKETGIASERPQVAAVFINRLRQGMKLQSDPTIIYGITKGKALGRKIYKTEITQNHPWNTYVIIGLPPTAIANPGKDAIAAVLNPPESKDLFFVADGSGGHVFAQTYQEHQKNVEKWRAFRANQESRENTLEGAK